MLPWSVNYQNPKKDGKVIVEYSVMSTVALQQAFRNNVGEIKKKVNIICEIMDPYTIYKTDIFWMLFLDHDSDSTVVQYYISELNTVFKLTIQTYKIM